MFGFTGLIEQARRMPKRSHAQLAHLIVTGFKFPNVYETNKHYVQRKGWWWSWHNNEFEVCLVGAGLIAELGSPMRAHHFVRQHCPLLEGATLLRVETSVLLEISRRNIHGQSREVILTWLLEQERNKVMPSYRSSLLAEIEREQLRWARRLAEHQAFRELYQPIHRQVMREMASA